MSNTVEYHRNYYAENKERIDAKNRKYYEEHRLSQQKRSREYWRGLSEEDRQLRSFRHRLKTRFGITPEQYDAILESQGGGCAICGGQKGNRRLPVDHDHKCCPGRKSCGKCIRGILCERCNVLVGYLEKFIDLLPKVELYLRT